MGLGSGLLLDAVHEDDSLHDFVKLTISVQSTPAFLGFQAELCRPLKGLLSSIRTLWFVESDGGPWQTSDSIGFVVRMCLQCSAGKS